MSESPTILNVGQCGLDGPRIKKYLESQFSATVRSADSVDDAREQIDGGGFDLVLTNRILDSTHEEGMDVVRIAAEHQVPVILVSNYDDAQEKAERAGAKPGFGKAALESEQTKTRIQSALAG